MDGLLHTNELLGTATKVEDALKGVGKPTPKKRIRSKTKAERRREARRMFTILAYEERERQNEGHV